MLKSFLEYLVVAIALAAMTIIVGAFLTVLMFVIKYYGPMLF